MNQNEFNRVAEEMFSSMQKLLEMKGGEYAGSEDRLANFKRGARLTGCTALQVAFVYASKHYDAVATFVRDQAEGKVRPSSEPIEGRFDDLANYCLLMRALVMESPGDFRPDAPGWNPSGTKPGESPKERMERIAADFYHKEFSRGTPPTR